MADQEHDVIVVGAGATGGLVAGHLAAAGYRVALLDAGPRWDRTSDYVNSAVDGQKLLWQDPRTVAGRHPVSVGSGRGVGGGTNAYCGVFPRMQESDFEVFSRDGVGADWPIGYRDLEPYYTRVEHEFGVTGTPNPFEPPHSPRPMPPHPLNWTAQILKGGSDALGLHCVPAPMAINSVPYGGRPACTYCNWCMSGCPNGSKATSTEVYIEPAESRGLRVISEAFVKQVHYDAQRARVTGVTYVDAEGEERTLRARMVVLAAHAVETPRLLLLSACDAFPDGLANRSGKVGVNYMTHPSCMVYGRMPEPVNGFKGMSMGHAMIQDFYATDPGRKFKRGYLLVSYFADPLSVASLGPELIGAEWKQFLKEYRYLTCWWILGEGLPNDHNRVTLDPEVRDERGLPVARLTHEWTDNDLALMEHGIAQAGEILEASGATRVYRGKLWAAHIMGTCRMGDDPSQSVVNPYSQSHDIPNLYICDTSTFVTGAAVNPTLTAMAISLRATEHMVAALRAGV